MQQPPQTPPCSSEQHDDAPRPPRQSTLPPPHRGGDAVAWLRSEAPGSPIEPLRFLFTTLVFGQHDIHLRMLRDRQQFSDPDGAAEALGVSPASWPLFGMVWEAGTLLATHMVTHPVAGLRVLEVGCGLGIASLVLSARGADITATDYNPAAGDFLVFNSDLNQSSPIPFVRQGWADENSALGCFDLIIGSDLLYEPDHAELLADFVVRHASAICEVILVDPGRGHTNRFSRLLEPHGFVREAAGKTTPGDPLRTYRFRRSVVA